MRYFLLAVFSCFLFSLTAQVTLEMEHAKYPSDLAVYNGKIYYQGYDPIHGDELWSYDGDTALLVFDFLPGNAGNGPEELYVFDNKLYFRVSRNSTYNSKTELWVYDGDTLHVVNGHLTTNNSSQGIDFDPIDFQEYNGLLYFSAHGGSMYYSNSTWFGKHIGRELFATNGDSVWLVADISPGPNFTYPYKPPNSSDPQDLIVYNNKLFFTAEHPSFGRELFSYNGSYVQLESDINCCNIAGSNNGSDLQSLFKYNNNLFFSARRMYITNDSINPVSYTLGQELYEFDGFNTTLVKDIYLGTESSNPQSFIEYNGEMFFMAVSYYTGFDLWSYNGSTTTSLDMAAGSATSAITNMIVYNNKLFIPHSLVWNNQYSYSDGGILSYDGNAFVIAIDTVRMVGPSVIYDGKLFFPGESDHGITGIWSYYEAQLCSSPENLRIGINPSGTVSLKWDSVAGCIGYRIKGKDINSSSFITIQVNGSLTTSYKATGLSQTATYIWQVQAICDTAGTNSAFSKFDTFNLSDCAIPSPTEVTNITPNSAVLRWTPVAAASAYWIIGKDLNSPTIRSLNVYNPLQDSLWVQLAPGNTYVWQMRAECPAPPNVSLFTQAQYFATSTTAIQKHIELQDGVVIIYPNPMDEYTNVQMWEDEITEVRLYDIQGNLVREIQTSSNKIQLVRDGLASGMYLLVIQSNNGEHREKLIIR